VRACACLRESAVSGVRGYVQLTLHARVPRPLACQHLDR